MKLLLPRFRCSQTCFSGDTTYYSEVFCGIRGLFSDDCPAKLAVPAFSKIDHKKGGVFPIASRLVSACSALFVAIVATTVCIVLDRRQARKQPDQSVTELLIQ